MVPHARRGAIAGLLELLNGHGGKATCTSLPTNSAWKWTIFCPSWKRRRCWASRNPSGATWRSLRKAKRSPQADIAVRKTLFREAILAHVGLLQQMHSALASKPDHSLPLEFFRDILEEQFSGDEVKRQIETALNWGRYGDIFTYDSESDRLVLHRAGRGQGRRTGERSIVSPR